MLHILHILQMHMYTYMCIYVPTYIHIIHTIHNIHILRTIHNIHIKRIIHHMQVFLLTKEIHNT